MDEKIKNLESLVAGFDKYDYYLNQKLDRDIEENRKGQFVIRLTDKDGNGIENAEVRVRQLTHEFKFGASLFHLDQFPDSERNAAYKEKFKKIFNYAVAPLYWDTLEPTEGKPRFAKDSEFISRRPPIDSIAEFCTENDVRLKGHCLIYNSFQPKWISEHNREIKIQIDNRLRAISERYGNLFEDADVINEMTYVYKNCYPGGGTRNLQITDERDHEKWCFDICKKYFPHTRLFWNEGMEETFGGEYKGNRSFYYMMIEKLLSEGVDVQGIGMQYHAFSGIDILKRSVNPLRIIDAFDCYGEFGLPIHMSEVSIPSYSNDEAAEELQAELTKRLFKLWFGRKNCEAIVWWNIADNTAYADENRFHAGLIRNDCTEKKVYKELDKLINSEWKTAFSAKASNELRFSGFYGDYEITVKFNGKEYVKNFSLHRDNTGYNNKLCDFRSKDFIAD